MLGIREDALLVRPQALRARDGTQQLVGLAATLHAEDFRAPAPWEATTCREVEREDTRWDANDVFVIGDADLGRFVTVLLLELLGYFCGARHAISLGYCWQGT